MSKTLWERFLDEHFCKAEPITGNRPCDSVAGICDACNTEEAQKFWQEWKAEKERGIK